MTRSCANLSLLSVSISSSFSFLETNYFNRCVPIIVIFIIIILIINLFQFDLKIVQSEKARNHRPENKKKSWRNSNKATKDK